MVARRSAVLIAGAALLAAVALLWQPNARRAPDGGCSGRETVRFGAPPMRLEDIGLIQPMGLMIGEHVTPIDHQYYAPKDWNTPEDRYDVFAPAAGVITHIQHRARMVGFGGGPANDFRVTIHYTCTFYSIYDLLTRLSPEVAAHIDFQPGGSWHNLSIPVKQGQVVGKIGGKTLDLTLVNTETRLPGLLVPEHYQHEPWKIHTVDPFDYFSEPLRSQLLALNVREAVPRGGKIDYDIDGRLAGNWFVENTNGYRGSDPQAYWRTHLSIAYDAIDPTQIRVSVGDFEGRARQFGVRGNGPDPATVSVASGPVRYELAPYQYYLQDTGRPWDRRSPAKGVRARTADGPVAGVIVLQLVSDRRLRVELSPGAGAVFYER